MKNFQNYFVITFALISGLMLFSCSKDRIDERDELNEYQSPNAYLDSKKQPEQDFLIDTNGTGPIVGNQGTLIWGTKNCLKLPNGDTIAFPFNVKLVELYTPKDMIYYRMPTVSSNRILETEGEIRLRAFKDGTELSLRPGCAYKVTMPESITQVDYMRVFYGFENNNIIDWTDDLGSLGVTQIENPIWGADTIGYTAMIERLGWINCDRLAGTTSGATVTFTSEVDDLTNVAIFAYLPATKTVMQAYNQSLGIIPNGTLTKIVAIAQDASGNLFRYYNELTINNSQSINIILSQISDSDLTAVLDGL